MSKSVFSVKLYDISEIADILGVSASYVRSAIASGELKARKLGKKWYVSSEHIEEFARKVDDIKPQSS